jgi:uncharacterized protein YcbK (DUF882 family)
MGKTSNGRFYLPGYKSLFEMNSSIAGADYFTWGEALHYEGGSNGYYRRPQNKQIVDNILKQSHALDKFRKFVGHPLIVTSWYRPPLVNLRVGGAWNSYHLKGLATDFYSPTLSIPELVDKVNEFGWIGGKGFYYGFIHLDLGVNRTWYG